MSASDRAFAMDLKQVVRLSWDLMTRAEQRRVGVLAAGMVLNGFLQTFSLALLIPFIGLMLDPSILKNNSRLGFIDRLLGSPSPETLIVICACALFGAIAFKNVFEYIYTFAQNRLIAQIERRVSGELLARCMAAPYEWFLPRNTTELITAIMSDVVMWGRAGLKSVLSLTSAAVLIVSILALIVSINPIFGVCLAIAATALGVAVIGLVRKQLRRLALRKHEAHLKSYNALYQAMSGFKDIKINGREGYFIHSYGASQAAYSNSEAALATVHTIPKYIIELAIALLLVAVGIVVSVNSALRAEMAALLAVYGAAAVRMVPIFNQVSLTVNAMHAAVPAILSVRQIQSELDALPSDDQLVASNPIGGWNRITFENIRYAYPKAEIRALAGVSLVIERGMRIGIVGRSGAGKTTLVDVLTGLLKPGSGRLTIGERELDDGNVRSWRQQIGYVPQAPFVADDTLRFNVTLEAAKGSVVDEKVLDALRVANLEDVLARDMTEGLDTRLGERGNRLSGGQRQRVAIARALYRNPNLLIFDEATSSLDAESENEISQALARISREKTLLIIAHRLSTVKNCDRILVLDKGGVIGFDTHDNLIRTCPLYRRFVELGDLSGAEPAEDSDQVAMVAAK